MSIQIRKLPRWVWSLSVVLLIVIAGAATANLWLPYAREQLNQLQASGKDQEPETAHPVSAEVASVELSPAGLKNIGYRPFTVKLGNFTRRLNVPAMVVERPGRTQIQISAPLTGIVTKIHSVTGSAVAPDAPLFEIRLTHEELVTAQSNLIRTAENLEVIQKEIDRLKAIGEGVIPGKRILEQEYEQQKLQAALKAERQALLLHGLNAEQIDSILRDHELFQSITVRAPAHIDESDSCSTQHLFHVQRLPVNVGQTVEAGAVLGVLADHCELFIEGRAFEDDAARLRDASREGWDVTASLLLGDKEADRIEGLRVLYVADHVDAESRALKFYLLLPNEIVLDQSSGDGTGPRFIEWRFKPGQRLELRIPVEEWRDRIVLPVQAIVQEGAETYVYQQNGSFFDKVPVHVEYRDQQSVIVANDGAIFPGDIIAARGAYEMHQQMKNKAGGGIDPHAGHNH